MPSPPLLDFDSLLAPIAGDEPAGESLPFAVRMKLDDARKEVNPELFDPDDPLRPDEPRPADWKAIIRLTKETLTDTSKDLMAAARLLEALVKDHGFAGLRDGLQLMRRMVEECWDRIHPSIEDGDLEVRATPFNWLDDPDRGARFPTSIRMVPVLQHDGLPVSWHNWKQSQEGKGPLKGEAFEEAVRAAPLELCKTMVEDLEAGQQELTQLTKLLDGKLGEVAPGMTEFSRALVDCLTLAQQLLKKKTPAGGDEEAAPAPTADGDAPAADGEAAPAGAAAGGPAGAGAPAKRMVTREDVYKQLRDAANLLQRIEPHSPIPYLLLRAIDLGGMPFPKLMKALIRDENVLTEMNRELGIKAEEPAE